MENAAAKRLVGRLQSLAGRRLRPTYSDGVCPFELVSTALKRSEGARRASIQHVPNDVRLLWDEFDDLRLFEDDKFGQWGLRFYSEQEAESATEDFVRTRNKDAVIGDLIVGEFLGDSDLLVVRANPDDADFGSVMIALPLDTRSEWYRPATTLMDFVNVYVDAEGEKFWELSAGLGSLETN